jgi:hypothetical protein
MLRQHVEGAGAVLHRVVLPRSRRIDGGAALQHLETVGRHEKCA